MYLVSKEKLILGHIPDSVKSWSFSNEKLAKNFFISMCNQLHLPYDDVIFSTDDYFIIAEGGGICYDYRVLLTFEREKTIAI